MVGRPPADITHLLLELRSPDADADCIRNRLYTAVYGELKDVAFALMRSERPNHTLQPTALLHEAYLKLVSGDRVNWRDRSHFYGIATRAMRQVLVEHARRRLSAKRGGNLRRVTLSEAVGSRNDPTMDILDLERVLLRLAELSERMARVVELRVFGGLPHREIALLLSVSERTAASDWSVARRWLARELAESGLV